MRNTHIYYSHPRNNLFYFINSITLQSEQIHRHIHLVMSHESKALFELLYNTFFLSSSPFVHNILCLILMAIHAYRSCTLLLEGYHIHPKLANQLLVLCLLLALLLLSLVSQLGKGFASIYRYSAHNESHLQHIHKGINTYY